MRAAGLAALALLLLAGCGLQPPLPEDRFYRLAPREAGPAAAPAALPGVLVVERPLAEGVYGERAILYSEDPGRRVLRQHHYSFWLKSPPRLVQDFLVAELRRLGAARRVVDGGVEAAGAYHLSARLLRFERLMEPLGVAVAAEFMLTPPERFEPAWVRRYTETRAVAEKGMTAAVAGFEAALAAVAGRLREDLAAFRAPGAGPRGASGQ